MSGKQITTYGPYSPIRKAGSHYFISGQVGINPETKQASASVTEQTAQLFENMRAVLGQAGLTFHDVVKTTVFLKNMSDFTAMNEIYLTYFAAPRPARSCVEVARLPVLADEALLVEIEAVAYKQNGET